MLLRKHLTAQKVTALLSAVLILCLSIALLMTTKEGEIAVMHVGNWKAPFGITLAVDMLSSVMLVLSGMLAVGVAIFACYDLDLPRMKFGFFPS